MIQIPLPFPPSPPQKPAFYTEERCSTIPFSRLARLEIVLYSRQQDGAAMSQFLFHDQSLCTSKVSLMLAGLPLEMRQSLTAN